MPGRVFLQLLLKYPFLGICIVVFTVSGSGKQSTGGILQHHRAAARACPEPSRGESPCRALQPHVSGFVFPLFSITPPLPGFSWGSRCVYSSGAGLSNYANICSSNKKVSNELWVTGKYRRAPHSRESREPPAVLASRLPCPEGFWQQGWPFFWTDRDSWPREAGEGS